MKQVKTIGKNIAPMILAILALIMIGGATTARAQNPTVAPLLDCISANADGTTTAVFGYNNTYADSQFYLVGPRNYFSPTASNQGQPNYFETGEHHANFTLDYYLQDFPTLTWYLDGNRVDVTAASPQCRNGSAITYQGRLTNAGAQASGSYDLQFRLYNQLTGGTAFGATITAANTSVVNGIFTVRLDFGADVYLSPVKLYLEISVKAAGGAGDYTTLAPRQPMTAVPYAVFAKRAATAGNADTLGGVYPEYFVRDYDARLSNARTPTAGSANYIQNSATRQATSNFNISGSGIVGDTLAVSANSGTNVVITGQSVSGIGTWLKLTNNSTGGTNWNLISTGNANAEGAGNLLFNNGTTQMILSPTALTVNSSLATNKVNVTGGVLARGGAPGGDGTNNNGYAFSGNGGDNDSGLFSEANGQVSLYTNAGERLRVTDSGATITGNLTVSGAISGATKNFKIDHPLDPLNKTLTYTSVESPDMKNIYDGNITTDANGEATVKMPDYFESLNKDFRYQLTVIGTFAQAVVLEEITGNTFKIKTDKPNVKVSWQVTGIRYDKFAEENRPMVEQTKTEAEKNKCVYAPACGQK